MKRLIIPTMLVLAVCSIAKAQRVTPLDRGSCGDCSVSTSQREQNAMWEARLAEAEHNKWPTRPQLTPLGKRGFARFTANFDFANDTDKKIKQVMWECTLVSLSTRETIASYTLVTRKGIAPHSTSVLSQAVVVPLEPFYPKVTSTSQTKQSKYELPKVLQVEQINRVKEIRYKDGSISTP